MLSVMNIYRCARLLCVTAAALTTIACARPPVEVQDAWVRDLIGGRDTTAGYFHLRNNGQAPLTLTGARAGRARAIEMHETVTRGDGVGMRRLQQVNVPPGTELSFQPGGKHLMIFGVEQLTDPFAIELLFAEREPIVVQFTRKQ